MQPAIAGPLRVAKPVRLGPALMAVLTAGAASAQNLLGVYLGGAFGESQISASSEGLVPTSVDLFGADNTAYEFVLGIRPLPLPWLGAEVEYVNLGHPDGTIAGVPATAVVRGGSAFGLAYLPLPGFDVFAKAGVARLQTSVGSRFSVPAGPFSLEQTNTAFAAGAGAQARFGQLGVRLQYEYFAIPNEGSGMLSLGLNWTF